MQVPNVVQANGSSIGNALQGLREVSNNLGNLGSGSTAEVLASYQRWASQSAQMLGYSFDQDALESLIMTRRHWWLMEAPVGDSSSAVIDMFRAEQADRLRTLDAVILRLDVIQRTAADMPPLAVLDTNVFMHHERYFDQVDWSSLMGEDRLRILVPIAVVRELDRLKRSAKNVTVSDTNKEALRTRARLTVQRLRRMFPDPSAVATIAPGLECELLLDPFRHQPLPVPDAEIIDRTLVASRMLGKGITVVTDDGGMEFATKIEGLRVVSPIAEAGEGPAGSS
jgi:hypothetical protein